MGVIALPEWPWRKGFGAAAVVVLHIAIVAVLLNATIVQRMFRPAPRETILYLRPLPRPKPQPAPQAKHIAPLLRAIVPILKLQNSTGITPPQTTDERPKTDSRPAYQLYDCRAANLPKLTADQRVACAKSAIGPKQDDNSVDYADHSDQVPGAARWAREKARKNGPTLLPCASNAAVTVGLGTVLCLANGAINGFDLDAQQQYGDRPEDYHVPNNGDPPPMYKDPDH